MAITAYQTVTAGNEQALDAAVAAAIVAGYQPLGTPFTLNGNTLVQAMVQGAPVTADDQFDDTAVLARLDALEATVDTAVTGLSAVVADHTTLLGTHTDEIADHESRLAVLEA